MTRRKTDQELMGLASWRKPHSEGGRAQGGSLLGLTVRLRA